MPNSQPRTPSQIGFTLIELLVAVAIVAILATIGMISYSKAQVIARDGKRKADLRAISTAVTLFYQTNKRYPCSGAGWQTTQDAAWLSDLQTTCYGTGSNTSLVPTYINALPRDPSGNNGHGYDTLGYGYFSTVGDYFNCKGGQFFILATQLENPSDPDRHQTKQYNACGEGTSGWGNNTYLLYL